MSIFWILDCTSSIVRPGYFHSKGEFDCRNNCSKASIFLNHITSMSNYYFYSSIFLHLQVHTNISIKFTNFIDYLWTQTYRVSNHLRKKWKTKSILFFLYLNDRKPFFFFSGVFLDKICWKMKAQQCHHMWWNCLLYSI